MALTCRKTLLLASSNRCLGHNIMGYKWGSITVYVDHQIGPTLSS